MVELFLNYLEIKLTEHCNLRCTTCCDFGNIAMEEEYGVETYIRDMKRLNELNIKIKKIRLLGGEPLLSKDINFYIASTRKYYKDAYIHLVTNGVLLEKMPDSFFRTISDYNVVVQISNYPEPNNQPYIERGKILLKENEINYFEYKPVCFETDYIFENNNEDVEKVFKRCNLIYDSTNLYRGRLYKCPRPISLRHYDKKYGTQLGDMTDGIDLFQKDINTSKIKELLNKPIRTCQYCTLYRGYVEWNQGSSNKNYWLNIPENDKLIDNYDKDSADIFRALERFEYLVIDATEGNRSLKKIKMSQLVNYSNYVFKLWLLDKHCIERFHFIKRILLKFGLMIEEYIVDNVDLRFWIDEEELWMVQEKYNIEDKENSLTILFSTDEKLTLRKILPLLR